MLSVMISINGRALSFYGVIRTHPVNRYPSPSTMCTYRVIDDEGNDLLPHPVKHRYGRGADALAQKVLGKIIRYRRG